MRCRAWPLPQCRLVMCRVFDASTALLFYHLYSFKFISLFLIFLYVGTIRPHKGRRWQLGIGPWLYILRYSFQEKKKSRICFCSFHFSSWISILSCQEVGVIPECYESTTKPLWPSLSFIPFFKFRGFFLCCPLEKVPGHTWFPFFFACYVLSI